MEPDGLTSRPVARPPLVRAAMAGLFLLGGLIASLGSLLPVWFYYLPLDLATAGNFFLAFTLGLLAAAMAARGIAGKLGLRGLLVAACFLTAAMMLVPAAVLSPAALVVPLILLGLASGMLVTGVACLLCQTMSPPMTTAMLSLAAVSFGAGAAGFNLLIWATVHILTVPRILVIAAMLPAGLGLLFLRQRSLPGPPPGAFARFSSPSRPAPLAMLLSLAMLIQAANEWAVGGWLGVYWIRRLGVRLETALLGLALYWTVLTLGKVLARRLSWAGGTFRMMTAGAAASLFGWLLSLSTRGVGGAVAGLLFLAAGMGLIYGVMLPMAAERFPLHQPGFFPWIASLGLIGGMLAPWSVGQLADAWGIEWAIHVPALGAVAVYVILSVVLLEARLARMGGTASQP